MEEEDVVIMKAQKAGKCSCGKRYEIGDAIVWHIDEIIWCLSCGDEIASNPEEELALYEGSYTVITAQSAGICEECENEYAEGERIEWNPIDGKAWCGRCIDLDD